MGGKAKDVGNAAAVRLGANSMKVTLPEDMTSEMDDLHLVQVSYWDADAYQEKVVFFRRVDAEAPGAKLISLGESLKARVMAAMGVSAELQAA